MRYYEFLLEYDRSRELDRIIKLPLFKKRFPNYEEDKDSIIGRIEKLEKADPTPNKNYVPRLIQWWLNGEKMEDLISTIADSLQKFDLLKKKNLLNVEDKDIGKFKTARLFSAKMTQYDLPVDKNVSEERGKYKEIANTSLVRVIQLFDVVAAKFWGRSTQWCTAATNNNMFSTYFKDGPLFVIIPKEAQNIGEKYQLWWEIKNQYNFQFMDVHDTAVKEIEMIIHRLNLQSIFSKFTRNILFHDNPSEENQLYAVRQDGRYIRYIKNPSDEVKLASVTYNGWTLEFIKNPTEEMQIAGAKQAPGILRKMPNLIDAAKIAALSSDGYMLEYIKNPTEKMKEVAVTQAGAIIGDIDNPSLTIQKLAVKSDPYAIHYIDNQTDELQAIALKSALKHFRDIDGVYRKFKNVSQKIDALYEKSRITQRNRIRNN